MAVSGCKGIFHISHNSKLKSRAICQLLAIDFPAIGLVLLLLMVDAMPRMKSA